MNIHPKQMVLAAALLAGAAGCAPLSQAAPADVETCAAGQQCTITGTIVVHRGAPASVAQIVNANGCHALALTEKDYLTYSKVPGARISVSGTAYNQNYDAIIASYLLKDRLVASGVCTRGTVLYVDSIKTLPER